MPRSSDCPGFTCSAASSTPLEWSGASGTARRGGLHLQRRALGPPPSPTSWQDWDLDTTTILAPRASNN
uniref:Uncharacterized protein n=1 Tax=Arundo donax TaxID=35708 RepID=A0A0A8Y8E2_ARUDO